MILFTPLVGTTRAFWAKQNHSFGLSVPLTVELRGEADVDHECTTDKIRIIIATWNTKAYFSSGLSPMHLLVVPPPLCVPTPLGKALSLGRATCWDCSVHQVTFGSPGTSR